MSVNFEELESLLFDWEAGSLPSDGVERVREILRTDEQARTWFVRQQMLSAALRLESDAGLSGCGVEAAAETRPVAAGQVSSDKRGVVRGRVWAIAMVSLLICILSGRVYYLESSTGSGEHVIVDDATAIRDQAREATSRGIALVTRLVDIQWNTEQSALDVGDALTPGQFAIDAGFAQIEFFCGATVVLEGPAVLDLKSPTLARVHRGRLRAHVPPAARGFSLEVEEMTVVDLGTEFGLSVSPEGADVQVFDGEIELHQPTQQKRHLAAGQGLVRTSDGLFESIDSMPDRFLDIDTLETRALEQRTARLHRWRAHSAQLRQDPRLIAYYAFEQQAGWRRQLNCLVEPASHELDGAIVGARSVAGRWPSKWALEFKQPGDRVRVQIPGEFSSLTFACWVRIDSLDRWFNSLFLTDGYNQGEPHWQILDSGQLYFSVRPTEEGQPGPHDYKVLSPPFWEPSMSGKWLHLATTYESETGTTTHFLNGAILHSERIPEDRRVRTTRIGVASIGNWASPTKPSSEFAIRNLNGQMDEFAIFAAALTAEEITEMYEHGKP